MDKFDYFVILAEMRTGSNFLEANLNAFEEISCLGEAFNPAFIAYPKSTELLGMDMAARDDAPEELITRIKDAPGLNGFRYFHDHEPRVFDTIMDDTRCAKIVLTRNPIESYVSWLIARSTGQWKLSDAKVRREDTAHFDAEEFASYLTELQQQQLKIQHKLQSTGQTAFYIGYDDLRDLAPLNGLARWLGVSEQVIELVTKLKVQNPAPLSEKVDNYNEMSEALAKLDRFNLSHTPNFEPRRGPAIPKYLVSRSAPMVYMPIPGGLDEEIGKWITALDAQNGTTPQTGFSSHMMQRWMQETGAHRKFSVVEHPLTRAYRVFCEKVLNPEYEPFAVPRRKLINRYEMQLPGFEGIEASRETYGESFKGFLKFLKGNLAHQTAIRVASEWSSQTGHLEGFARYALPDRILRAHTATHQLPAWAEELGATSPPPFQPAPVQSPVALDEIYDAEIEQLCRVAYRRDYLHLGYADWEQGA